MSHLLRLPLICRNVVHTSRSTLLQNVQYHRPNLKPLGQCLRETVTVAPSQVSEVVIRGRQKVIGWWLIGCSSMAFGTVVAGGVTRLTKAGLAMVDWNPVLEMWPRTKEEWEKEFEKYKQYPEFKHRSDMTVEQFKWIWHMEYGHRSLGRLIGAAFFLPATVFWLKGWFDKALKKRVLLLGGLLAFQGALGWYMVRSGLEDKTYDLYGEPRVSHYRLASHLGTAFLFYSALLSTGLKYAFPPSLNPCNPSTRTFARLARYSRNLVFLTAVSGAFVAGLEAGLVYNTFPKFADRWIPSDLLAKKPIWKNFFENVTTVQFDHRLLGIITWTAISSCWVYGRFCVTAPRLSRRTRLAADILMLAALLQVTLGISTLLTHVPKELAASHQAGALTLLSFAIWLNHELRLVQRLPK